jgi:hypothetical protein
VGDASAIVIAGREILQERTGFRHRTEWVIDREHDALDTDFVQVLKRGRKIEAAKREIRD